MHIGVAEFSGTFDFLDGGEALVYGIMAVTGPAWRRWTRASASVELCFGERWAVTALLAAGKPK